MKIFLDCSDKRLFFVKQKLEKLNYNVNVLDFLRLDRISSEDIVILSPAFKCKVEDAKALPKNITIICGAVSEEVKMVFNKKLIKHYNLMEDETFVLKNANLTAEGMLADLIFYTKKSIYDCNILILGGGRVAKAVALTLFKLGINFSISMRNDNKLIESQLITKNILSWQDYKENLFNYDVVINTIPSKIFNEEDLSKFKTNSVVFELASKQCLEGLSFKNFTYVLCPALPAKYCPEAAGELVYKFVANILGEK